MGGAPPANACEFIHQVIFCRMNDCFWPIAAIVGGALTALPHARVSVARAKDKQSNFRRLFERSARGAQRVPPDRPPARRAFSFPGFFWQDKRNRVAAGRLPASASKHTAKTKQEAHPQKRLETTSNGFKPLKPLALMQKALPAMLLDQAASATTDTGLARRAWAVKAQPMEAVMINAIATHCV